MRHSVEKRFGFVVGFPALAPAVELQTCSKVSLYRSHAFRRNNETRSVRADLSHHGDGCLGRKQPRDWEGTGHFMAVKTAALKQNHFTAKQHFPRRSTEHISSCTWLLHYTLQTPTEHNKFCLHTHGTGWLCITGLISISLPLFLWQEDKRPGAETAVTDLSSPRASFVRRWLEKEGG